MIDPLERWAQYGEKPDYAGLLNIGFPLFSSRGASPGVGRCSSRKARSTWST
jgi:hypothetical protein